MKTFCVVDWAGPATLDWRAVCDINYGSWQYGWDIPGQMKAGTECIVINGADWKGRFWETFREHPTETGHSTWKGEEWGGIL